MRIGRTGRKIALFCGVAGWMIVQKPISAQQVRLDNLKEQFSKKNLVKMNGGIAANGVFYNGNNSGRQPFMWALTGNINLNFFNQIDLPFSYSINNMGDGYSYPALPNRFSLHPCYKWVTAHIGDVSMNLSPYTLNGHQFTGAGVELQPQNLPFKFAAMSGRLLKATEYDPGNYYNTVAYKRVGYGFGVEYDNKDYLLGMTLFHAHDEPNSLSRQPDSLQVYPHSNLAVSVNTVFKVTHNLSIKAEYGISFLSRDLRLPKHKNTLGRWLLDRNASTVHYQAVKTGINYQLKKNMIGFGYERIDPDYQTLGAYYFTNDLENFTLNFSRPFWKDKITLAVNMGLQHDNLKKQKTEQTNRWVLAANVNVAPGEKWTITWSYSSFQSYTNIKSQFDYINETNQYENLDTLDFTQLSQNMDVNVSYRIEQNDARNQRLSMTVNFQESADKRAGILARDGASQFCNLSASYGLLFVPSTIQVTASGNLSYSTAGLNEMLTYGPNLGISAGFFRKKVSAGLSSAYNVSENSGKRTGTVLNIRGNASWRFFKRHNVNLSSVYQSRSVPEGKNSADFTTTVSYSYSF